MALLAEYDALPEVGHACGHNVICTAALGAALALQPMADSLGLKITVLGCKPTGLVLVSNLNPKSRKLSSNYDALVRDWVPVTLAEYGTDRFFGAFDYVPCSEVSDDGFALFDKVRLPEDAAPAPAYVTP